MALEDGLSGLDQVWGRWVHYTMALISGPLAQCLSWSLRQWLEVLWWTEDTAGHLYFPLLCHGLENSFRNSFSLLLLPSYSSKLYSLTTTHWTLWLARGLDTLWSRTQCLDFCMEVITFLHSCEVKPTFVVPFVLHCYLKRSLFSGESIQLSKECDIYFIGYTGHKQRPDNCWLLQSRKVRCCQADSLILEHRKYNNMAKKKEKSTKYCRSCKQDAGYFCEINSENAGSRGVYRARGRQPDPDNVWTGADSRDSSVSLPSLSQGLLINRI